jgi:hypothetical protein
MRASTHRAVIIVRAQVDLLVDECAIAVMNMTKSLTV